MSVIRNRCFRWRNTNDDKLNFFGLCESSCTYHLNLISVFGCFRILLTAILLHNAPRISGLMRSCAFLIVALDVWYRCSHVQHVKFYSDATDSFQKKSHTAIRQKLLTPLIDIFISFRTVNSGDFFFLNRPADSCCASGNPN